MRQQVFDFVREALTESAVSLDPVIEDEVVRLMAATIVAACRRGADESDDKSSRQRQDRD